MLHPHSARAPLNLRLECRIHSKTCEALSGQQKHPTTAGELYAPGPTSDLVHIIQLETRFNAESEVQVAVRSEHVSLWTFVNNHIEITCVIALGTLRGRGLVLKPPYGMSCVTLGTVLQSGLM